MAPADGAGRRRGQVPGQIGRIAPVACLGVPVPGCGRSGGCAPGSGLAGCREYWCRRLAWVILVQALAAPCLVPRAG